MAPDGRGCPIGHERMHCCTCFADSYPATHICISDCRPDQRMGQGPELTRMSTCSRHNPCLPSVVPRSTASGPHLATRCVGQGSQVCQTACFVGGWWLKNMWHPAGWALTARGLEVDQGTLARPVNRMCYAHRPGSTSGNWADS